MFSISSDKASSGEHRIENTSYMLKYIPPEQADAFWLPAAADEALAFWHKQSKTARIPMGCIWFCETQAGGGQLGTSAHFDTSTPGKAPKLHAGVCGKASLHILKKSEQAIHLSGLLQDVIELCEKSGFPVERPLGISLHAENVALEYGHQHSNGRPQQYDEAEAAQLDSFGFLFRKPEHIPRDDAHIRAVCEHISRFPAGGGVYAWLYGKSNNPEINGQPEPETLLHGPTEIRIYVPVRRADAADTAFP
ncbi:MAG: hypothetical protein ACOC2C_00890 [Cyclonatronaceae bacterium]